MPHTASPLARTFLVTLTVSALALVFAGCNAAQDATRAQSIVRHHVQESEALRLALSQAVCAP